MREALGLGGRRDNAAARQPAEQQRPPSHRPAGDRPASNGHRHRFVQDGEVPVVLVNHAGGAVSPSGSARGDSRAPNPRAVAVAADVSVERTARERAERQVQQAQASIRDLETKLAHADMARAEAVAAAQADRATLAALQQELHAQIATLSESLAAERVAREFAETALRDALAAAPPFERAARIPSAVRLSAEPASAKLGRKRADSSEQPARGSKRAVAEPKPVKWWVKAKTAKG